MYPPVSRGAHEKVKGVRQCAYTSERATDLLRERVVVANKRRAAASRPWLPAEGIVLYLLRHSAAIAQLELQKSLEELQVSMRIKDVNTLLKAYARHDVPNDPFAKVRHNETAELGRPDA